MGRIDDWQNSELDAFLGGQDFVRRRREYRRTRGDFHQIVQVEPYMTVGDTRFQLFAAVSSIEMLTAFERRPNKPEKFEDWHWSISSVALETGMRSAGDAARRWLEHDALPDIERMSRLTSLIEHARSSEADDRAWRDSALAGKVMCSFGTAAERGLVLRDYERRFGHEEIQRAAPFTPRQMSRPRFEKLIAKAKSPRWKDRWGAAIDLGRWRTSGDVVAALWSLAGDTNPSVRIRAVVALAKHGESSVLPKALELLEELDGAGAAWLTWAIAELAETPDERRDACEALLRLRERATGLDLQGILIYESKLGCPPDESSWQRAVPSHPSAVGQ